MDGRRTGPPNQITDHAAELKVRPQWICYQLRNKKRDKPDKVPVDPKNPDGPGIDGTLPVNWMFIEEVKRYSEDVSSLDGYGFAVHEDDPYVFIDDDRYADKDTGEPDERAIRLVNCLDSYSYFTPSNGIRTVIKGELDDSGGKYLWVDPDTGEEHVFEVYDRKRFLTFSERVFHNVPIREAPGFLNSLTKVRSGKSPTRKASDLPEVELPEDLSEIRERIKLLFLKHSIDPGPMTEGFRKNTLISHFRKIACNQDLEIDDELDADGDADELWKYLNWANETMCYDENGRYLKGLDKEELTEIYDEVLKNLRDKSPKEVQEKLDELHKFLVNIKVKISFRLDSRWKIVKAFEEHGRKYGTLLPDNKIRIDMGWIALGKQARIKSNATLNKNLEDLGKTGIIAKRGRNKGDRAGYFIIDLEKAKDLSCWGLSKMPLQKNSDPNSYYFSTPSYYFSTPAHKEETNSDPDLPEWLLEALTHTTWYRGVGPTKIRYILAILSINADGKEATGTEIARRVGVRPTSVSRPLRDLKESGVIHQKKSRGPYEIKETVAEDLYRVRVESGEFSKDEKARKDANKKRRAYEYQTKLKDLITEFLRKGDSPTLALGKAEGLVSVPKDISKDELHRRKESSLSWANKSLEWENKKAKKGRCSKRQSDSKADDVGFQEKIREEFLDETDG